MTKPKHTLTIRVEPALADEVRRAAHANLMSVNEWLTGVIEQKLLGAKSDVHEKRKRQRKRDPFPIDEGFARVVVDNYVRQGKSRYQICREFGLSDSTVVRVLRRKGVRIRSLAEATAVDVKMDGAKYIPTLKEILDGAIQSRRVKT
jgi:hypothetical protein